MPAYMLLEIEVLDLDLYAEYVAQAPATVKQYGGGYLVRSSDVTPISGGWQPQRLVVLEFPSIEDMRRWNSSPEYSAIAPLRERATKSRVISVEGHSEDA